MEQSAKELDCSTDYLLGLSDIPTPIGKGKTADDALNEFAVKEGLGNESLDELRKFAELLRIKEMQKNNAKFADELSIKE